MARDAPQSPAAEAYRNLRTAIKFMSLDRPIHSILVTSARPGEGKTTTATNLAVVAARSGQRVWASRRLRSCSCVSAMTTVKGLISGVIVHIPW